jgi:integrase
MNETVKGTLEALKGRGPYIFSEGHDKRHLHVDVPFKVALRQSEIEDFRFHDLRHTFASNMVMAGEDLNTVRELLGHKDLTMTLRYAHLSPNHKMKAVNILDRVMSQNPPQEETQERKVLEFKR